jgi:hypothetical protein
MSYFIIYHNFNTKYPFILRFFNTHHPFLLKVLIERSTIAVFVISNSKKLKLHIAVFKNLGYLCGLIYNASNLDFYV